MILLFLLFFAVSVAVVTAIVFVSLFCCYFAAVVFVCVDTIVTVLSSSCFVRDLTGANI
jgi:hypothetical protein